MGNEIKRCVIISGAPETDIKYYSKYINNSYIICADSGYLKCERLGIKYDLAVGDFDSSAIPDCDCEIVKLNVRKDDTDTFHCVKEATRRGYNDIVILGGIGSRFDHTYANILALDYCRSLNINACLINNNNKVFITDKPVTLMNDEYKHFSLYALFDTVYGLNIINAQYPLDNYTLSPFDQLTQSNGFKEGDVSITFNSGKLLVILCND